MYSQDEARTIIGLTGDGNMAGVLANYTHDSDTYGESHPVLKCGKCDVTVGSVDNGTTLAEQVATVLIHEQGWHS